MAKILTVDDRALNRKCLSVLLVNSGHSMTEAASGAEAIDAARACPPDLIIADVLMPGMDGFELCYRLKQDAALAEIPIIFYTAAFNLNEVQRLAAAHGNCAVLAKPSNSTVILATVAQLLNVKAAASLAPDPAGESFSMGQSIGLQTATLLEVSLALAAEQLPETMLKVACRGAQNILDAPYVALALLDEAGCLQHLETTGLADGVRAALGSRPSDASFLATFHAPVDSVLSEVIQTPSRRYGWLYVAGRRAVPALAAASGQLATHLAAQVAQAWENLQYRRLIANRERRLSNMIESAMDAIITLDKEQRIQIFNSAAEAMFECKAADVFGRPLAMLLPQCLRAGHFDYVQASGAANRPMGARSTVTGIRANGKEFPAEAAISRVDANGDAYYTIVLRDITERKQAEQLLRIAATAFESQEAMMVTDADNVILHVNRSFAAITGYAAEDAVGRKACLLKSDRHDAAFYAAMWASIGGAGAWQGEIWNRHKDGAVYPARLAVTAVMGGKGEITHYVGMLTDITLRKAAEDRIKHLAFHDSLTRLPNRRLLLDRLQQALGSSARSGHEGALLFVDLDNFKTLNDTLGHDIGDLLLQQVAQRLATCVREHDTVARLGGDEFVLLLEGLSKTPQEAASQTRKVCEKVLATLSQPYLLAGHQHHSSSSIGAALFDDHRNTAEELLKRADLAMYQAKAAGRNTLCFFDPQMQAAVIARATLEADLRQGLRQKEFLLYYQPQVDAAGSRTGAEALVRWRHPRRGLISPADFIPLAEETGLILPLGQWVLQTACGRLAAWAAQPGMAHLILAVNVSARQFHHPDFVDQVLAVLDQTGADPRKLKIELTESLLLDDVEKIIAKMTALKAKGAGFSLDDFGTGYSSLSYLKRLPLDQLKIDRSFVRDILADANDAAITRTIVALAHSMALGVIAEGVETEGQRDFLMRQGCHAYQGYLFGRPMPIDEFEKSGHGVSGM